MLKINEKYTFDIGTLYTNKECNLFLHNTLPVHDLPKKTYKRFKCIREALKIGKGLDLPPVLIFIGDDKAKSGCHRHHAYLELYGHGINCILPVFLVSLEQRIDFFRAIGGFNPNKETLYALQEKFHKWLVKKGLYTKRILNRRLKEESKK